MLQSIKPLFQIFPAHLSAFFHGIEKSGMYGIAAVAEYMTLSRPGLAGEFDAGDKVNLRADLFHRLLHRCASVSRVVVCQRKDGNSFSVYFLRQFLCGIASVRKMAVHVKISPEAFQTGTPCFYSRIHRNHLLPLVFQISTNFLTASATPSDLSLSAA